MRKIIAAMSSFAAAAAILAGTILHTAADKPIRVVLGANGGKFSDGASEKVVSVEEKADLYGYIPEETGAEFAGWYLDESGTTPAPDLSNVVNGTTLYAGWNPKTFTVTFMNGDSVFHTETVEYGKMAEAPDSPAEEGMEFTGWFTDVEESGPYDFSSPVLSDFTLHAGFEAETTLWDLRSLPNFTFVSQVKPSLVWMGCESASLLMALKTTGHELNTTYPDFLAQLPMTDTDNPYLGFCGDLYSDTWMRDAVMPNIVAEWGSQYGNTRDLTKQGLDPVIAAIKNGHPVVVWTSVHMQPSETVWDDTQAGVTDDAADPLTGEVLNYHGSTGSHWEYKTHNHVMTLLGYNSETNEFLLGDPAEWLGETYWVTYDTFMASWNCYQGAVEVW